MLAPGSWKREEQEFKVSLYALSSGGGKKTGVGTLVTVVDERAILEILNAMKVAKFGAGRGAFIGHF